VNRVRNILSQLLQWLPRVEFQLAVIYHKPERRARGFTCWGQLVAMLFCRLKDLEIPLAPKMSKLAYAHEHRPREFGGFRVTRRMLLGRGT